MENKESQPSKGQALSRREWVQRMVVGAGAGIAAPGLAEAGWSVPSVPSGTASAVGDWTPVFFDDAQNEALIVIAERIVPGSGAAQVNRFLDIAIAASTQENQRKFVDAINAIEGEALHQFEKSFKTLSAEQQDAVLQAMSTADPANTAPQVTSTSRRAELPKPPALRDHFDHLKNWISSAYYSSEIGMKELGWNGENFFSSLPGCEHPDGHS